MLCLSSGSCSSGFGFLYFSKVFSYFLSLSLSLSLSPGERDLLPKKGFLPLCIPKQTTIDTSQCWGEQHIKPKEKEEERKKKKLKTAKIQDTKGATNETRIHQAQA